MQTIKRGSLAAALYRGVGYVEAHHVGFQGQFFLAIYKRVYKTNMYENPAHTGNIYEIGIYFGPTKRCRYDLPLREMLRLSGRHPSFFQAAQEQYHRLVNENGFRRVKRRKSL